MGSSSFEVLRFRCSSRPHSDASSSLAPTHCLSNCSEPSQHALGRMTSSPVSLSLRTSFCRRGSGPELLRTQGQERISLRTSITLKTPLLHVIPYYVFHLLPGRLPCPLRSIRAETSLAQPSVRLLGLSVLEKSLTLDPPVRQGSDTITMLPLSRSLMRRLTPLSQQDRYLLWMSRGGSYPLWNVTLLPSSSLRPRILFHILGVLPNLCRLPRPHPLKLFFPLHLEIL